VSAAWRSALLLSRDRPCIDWLPVEAKAGQLDRHRYGGGVDLDVEESAQEAVENGAPGASPAAVRR
jgi:hypothetical protein